ncbi:MAG: alpha/beta hydrolase [Candidatus Eremiobacteraeota bacterium]|nr:alpha/beta hydrolase [Candidatus Eremiobacteraeota bacterium]
MTLLFVHGAGCTPDVFRAQMDAFAGAFAPGLPGHGKPGSGASIEEYSDFVEAFARDNHVVDIVLCGHSMGAAVALTCAARGSLDIKGVVVLGGGATMPVSDAMLQGMQTDFDATSRRLAKAFFADPAPECVDWAAAMLATVGMDQTLADFRACAAFDARPWLSDIQAPLLAVTGAADRLMPGEMADDLVGRVAGAQARRVESAGHFAPVERAGAVNQLIRDFVDGVPVRG